MSRNDRSRRKNKRERRRRAKYGIVLHTKPEYLSATELAVLIATTTHLTELSNLPKFDPTKVHVQLTFPSGNLGCASLARSGERPPGSEVLVDLESAAS